MSDEITVTVRIDGTERRCTVGGGATLLELLREDAGVTEVHRGCDSARCGACTVLLDGDPVKACTVLAGQADGASVTTAAGLAEDGELHPVQSALAENHGLQCGFCTPGMVVSAAAFLEDAADPSREEIREALTGNLCRCTGYTKIVEGIERAASEMD